MWNRILVTMCSTKEVARQMYQRTWRLGRNYTNWCDIKKGFTVVYSAFNNWAHLDSNFMYSSLRKTLLHSWRYFQIDTEASTSAIRAWRASISRPSKARLCSSNCRQSKLELSYGLTLVFNVESQVSFQSLRPLWFPHGMMFLYHC